MAPISDAFRTISRATDEVSATLKPRDFRLGLAPNLISEICAFFADLKDEKTGGHVALIVRDADLEDVLEGRVDAFLRVPIKSVPGLHVDQLEIPALNGETVAVTLVLQPGIVGCREHELFLSAVGKV